jgi:hypothetical protein
MHKSLVASMCLSFDSQMSVNERLTRVVCLSISFSIYILCINIYMYVHVYICVRRVHTLLWRRFSYLIVIVAVLSLTLFSLSSSFSLFLVTTSFLPHIHTLSLSLSLSLLVLCIFFYSCLSILTLISVDVCLWHILHHFIFALSSVFFVCMKSHKHMSKR